jgi:hypothetical protein
VRRRSPSRGSRAAVADPDGVRLGSVYLQRDLLAPPASRPLPAGRAVGPPLPPLLRRARGEAGLFHRHRRAGAARGGQPVGRSPTTAWEREGERGWWDPPVGARCRGSAGRTARGRTTACRCPYGLFRSREASSRTERRQVTLSPPCFRA